jgi:2-oxoglutarate dehydrogenase E2 component (dihydrolipoamide succinyltransferase)
MRVDIIAPNFDDSSDKITLSSWHKKIGEKISKNEIIAEAETDQIACGITSSYDCILAKILVEEGGKIFQGAKIAVIETDMNADISDIKQSAKLEEIKMESSAINEQIKNDVIEQEKMRRSENKYGNEAYIGGSNLATMESDNGYSLTVSTSDTGKNEYVFNVVEAKNIEEKMELATELSEELVEESIIDDFEERSEIKVAHIMREAEKQAKDEAKKIKEQIIEDAKKKAVQQAEEIKNKILREYEEKATKDASEMLQKIVQGSILEAENTKIKLLDRAREKAQTEADALKGQILKNAEMEAMETAKNVEKEIVEKAKENAEKITKNIIEDAIQESKMEAKSIKKDIIHSANRHAKKESKYVIYEAIKNAKIESSVRSEKIINDTLAAANKEAIELKNEIIQSMSVKLNDVISSSVTGVREQIQKELSGNFHSLMSDLTESIRPEIRDSMNSSIQYIMSKTNYEIKDIMGNMIREILSTSNHEIKCTIYSTFNDISKDINKELKNEIKSLIKNIFCETVGEIKCSANLILREKFSEFNKEIKHEINDSMKKILHELQNEKSTKRQHCSDQSEVDETSLGEKIVEERIEELRSEEKIMNMLLNDKYKSGETMANVGVDNWNKPKFFSSPDDENVPIDFLKQRINEKLKSSLESSVISTVSNEVDMTAILSLEKTFGKEFSKKHSTRLGFTPFFILASVSALKERKMFNAHIHENNIIYKNDFDISVITCGNDGVIAPVIRQANLLSISEIEKSMIALSRRAIEGTLSLEEVSGGTFTVVNAGVYGSIMGTDLLTPPQVATLSVHRMHNRPIATDDGVEIRPMLYVSLSYDHRAADTKQASEFLEKVKNYVENPGWTILEL